MESEPKMRDIGIRCENGAKSWFRRHTLTEAPRQTGVKRWNSVQFRESKTKRRTTEREPELKDGIRAKNDRCWNKMRKWRHKQNINSTRGSQAVTHPSTKRALRCLTSGIGREPVCSTWYGRWQEKTLRKHWRVSGETHKQKHLAKLVWNNQIQFNFGKIKQRQEGRKGTERWNKSKKWVILE